MPDPNQNGNKDWLIMLYMAGDNSLNDEMILSLQYLVDAAPFENDAIVAEFDSSQLGRDTERYDFTTPNGYRLKNYLVTDPNQVSKEKSTGNPETLEKFLKWAAGRYPAERRILILSGHGSGATEDCLLWDENPEDSLTIPELKDALRNAGYGNGAKKLDIIGMGSAPMDDQASMATWTVAPSTSSTPHSSRNGRKS